MTALAIQRSVKRHQPVRQFAGARLVASIGVQPDTTALPVPIAPSASQLFAPRGLCLFANEGPLWVADSGHHRVLGWRDGAADGRAADWVLGQRSFDSERPNDGREVDGTTLRLPTSICRYRDGLAIADSWNHRVLIWDRVPQDAWQPADRVLGQNTLHGAEPNRSRPSPGADTLHWPYGVAADGDTLVVADTGNRRVLLWQQPPAVHGAPADVVLGQADGASRDLDNGRLQPAALMRWPHGIVIGNHRLMVADAGMHRISIWNCMPSAHGTLPDIILGQNDPRAADANAGAAGPSPTGFNMPYAIAVSGTDLVVADTCNSRLLAWPLSDLGSARPATQVWGQPDFHSRGDNAWEAAGAASLCWPYGLSACGNRLGIADTGNNRVQIWEVAS
jgi:hypothetical protein